MAQKKSGGDKNFSPRNQGPLTFNVLPTPVNLPRLWNWHCHIDVYECGKTYLNQKMHKIWSVDSQENY